MSASSARLALPDPHPLGPHDHPRFAVASWSTSGSGTGDVKLYEWRRSKGEMGLVGLQTDVGPIRTAALSPIPTQSSLIALGLQTGRVLLLPLSPSTLSQPLSAPTYPALPLKHARPVSALAFAPADPNYLAVGLDKHRSDPSLVVWDVERAVSSIPADRDRDRNPGQAPWTRPPERLQADASSPSAGAYDGRVVQSYCAGEQVNSVAWLHHTVFSLLAGVSNKQIRLYDLRQPSSAPGAAAASAASSASGIASTWSTRAVTGIVPDPRSETRFASFEASAAGSVVRLWDTRKAGEVLSFDVVGSVLHVQWGEGRGDGRARLGVGTRSGGVGVWDVDSGRATVGDKGKWEEWVELGDKRRVIKPKSALQTFTFLPTPPTAFGTGRRAEEIAFVFKDGAMGVGPIGEPMPLASSARGDVAYGEGSEVRLVEPSEGALVLLGPNTGRGIGVEGASGATRALELDPVTWKRALEEDVGSRMRKLAEDGYGLDEIETNIELLEKEGDALADLWRYSLHLLQTLSPDLARTATHDLTYSGIYSLWSGLPPLAASSSGPSPRYPTAALPAAPAREPIRQTSAAWATLRGQSGPGAGRTTTGLTPAEENTGGSAAAHEAWLKSVEEVVRRLGGGARAGVRVKSTKEGARRVILRLCEVEGHEHEWVVVSIKEKDRTKVAWRHFFSGDENAALRVLLDSPEAQCRLYATTISAFLTSRPTASPISPSQPSTQGRSAARGHAAAPPPKVADDRRAVIASIEDAHVRSILLRASGVEWAVVVGDTQLPVLDRIWLGASNLPDGDFGALLADLHAGLASLPIPLPLALPLCGFTPSLVPHLKAYVDTTSDVQLVALLGAHIPLTACPSAEKTTLRRWRETYRDLLDAWGMWGERVGYDQGYMRAGRQLGEHEAAERGDARGIKVCPACNNALTSGGAESVYRKTAGAGGMDAVGKVTITERSGACALCAQVLPRCCICLTHVQAHSPALHTAWDALDQAYVHCVTCRHGGHAEHLLSWFEGGLDGEQGHDTCPVSGCGCECAAL